MTASLVVGVASPVVASAAAVFAGLSYRANARTTRLNEARRHEELAPRFGLGVGTDEGEWPTGRRWLLVRNDGPLPWDSAVVALAPPLPWEPVGCARGFLPPDVEVDADPLVQPTQSYDLGAVRRGETVWCQIALQYGPRISSRLAVLFDVAYQGQRWLQVPASELVSLPSTYQNGPGSGLRPRTWIETPRVGRTAVGE